MKAIFKDYTLLVLLLAVSMTGLAKGENGLKPRLVVCTDIAPADVEPDDMESMVRLMAYADCFEVEALITSVGWNCSSVWLMSPTSAPSMSQRGVVQTRWHRPSGE